MNVLPEEKKGHKRKQKGCKYHSDRPSRSIHVGGCRFTACYVGKTFAGIQLFGQTFNIEFLTERGDLQLGNKLIIPVGLVKLLERGRVGSDV